MERMGKIPEKGEFFTLNDLTITAVETDLRHVIKIEVKKLPGVTSVELEALSE